MILSVPTSTSNLPDWVGKAARAINQLIAKRANVDSVDAAITLNDGHDVVLCDATSAAFTVTLPKAAPNKGKLYRLKKVDSSANAITIDGDGSETIDGATTQSLASQWDIAWVFSNGTAWFLL